MQRSILLIVTILTMSHCISVAFGDDQLEVTVGDEFTIASSSPPFAFPTLHKLAPESLFLAVWDCADASLPLNDVRQTVVYTTDGGKKWEKPVPLVGTEAGGHSFIRKRDGDFVWLSYFTQPIDSKTLACKVGRSTDGRKFEWSDGTVSFPQPIRNWSSGNAYMLFARSIIELADGSLIASMYGYFEDDPVYRCLLVRSTDGTNWDYYSTIAYSDKAPGEGYCEPVIVRTSGDDLLCVMRLGSGLPMESCRSRDDGASWSKPEILPDFAKSVFPDAILMSNGVLALSYGRPGGHIAFSANGMGYRWTSPTTVFSDKEAEGKIKPGDFREPTCAYTAIQEVAPGRLLYVYSYLEHQVKPGSLDSIRGVFIDVERVGIE